jgi:hypothetical protein
MKELEDLIRQLVDTNPIDALRAKKLAEEIIKLLDGENALVCFMITGAMLSIMVGCVEGKAPIHASAMDSMATLAVERIEKVVTTWKKDSKLAPESKMVN